MPIHALAIDRLQPPSPAFLQAIAAACTRFDTVLVLVSGAARPRDWRYPLSWQERVEALRAAVPASNLTVLPLIDTLYDDGLWVAHVRRCLEAHARHSGAQGAPVLLVAPGKAGQAMGRLFPDWQTQEALPGPDPLALARLYQTAPGTHTGPLEALAQEAMQAAQERARWQAAEEALGYPIPLNTVDAVVVQSHHVLLVEREAGSIGAGLLSLPGSFIAQGQTALDTILATLRTKAGLDMPLGALSGRLAQRRVFDHPDRDPRGWIRTEAFVFDLPASGRMEAAKRAQWIPLAALDSTRLFADHGDIIQA